MSKIKEQVSRIKEWAECIDLYPNTTPMKQLEKFGEEFLEFVGHSAKMEFYEHGKTKLVATTAWHDLMEKIEDDIGDMCVTIVNVLLCAGWDVEHVALCFGDPEFSKGSLKKDIEATHACYFECILNDNVDNSSFLFGYVEMLAARYDINVAEALENAVDVIWERRHSGKMRDGHFVKAEDL